MEIMFGIAEIFLANNKSFHNFALSFIENT